MRRPIELLLCTIRRVNRPCGELKKFLQQDPGDLVFRSQFGNPLLETTILNRGLYPVSETVGFTERRFPRVPTWMQPKMGAGWFESGSYPSANGSHFAPNDDALQRRNSVSAGGRGIFQTFQHTNSSLIVSYWKIWKMNFREKRLQLLEKNGAAYENRTHA